MPLVTICAGLYCQGRQVARAVSKGLGIRLLDDQGLVELSAQSGRLGNNALTRALTGRGAMLDRSQQERDRAISQLKLAMSELVLEGDLVFLGLGALLVPLELPQVLRVGLIAESGYRLQRAEEEDGLDQREAKVLIGKSDKAAMRWSQDLWGTDPWQAANYDILLPMDKKDLGQAVEMILHHAASQPLSLTNAAEDAARDYHLAARAQVELGEKGHMVRATANQGVLVLEINKKVLRFAKLEAQLKELAGALPGVKEVVVKPGPGAHKADIYRAHEFEAPSKILLVDDEREFVETLSERLMMRDMNAAVVYDGEQALKAVAEEEPEIIVLDLMMPGIDGMEVLQRIKREHPQVEVLVLTGHGSGKDREACLAAGAYAYLQKPVDIEELARVMRSAYNKSKGGEAAQEEET